MITRLAALAFAVAVCTAVPGAARQAGSDCSKEQSSDGLWRRYSGDAVASDPSSSAPNDFYVIDEQVLERILGRATEPGSADGTEISLPLPGQKFGLFKIVESNVMPPDLKAKYPNIRAYQGWRVDDRSASVRVEVTSSGFHAHVLSPEGDVFIDPWKSADLYALRSRSREN